MNLIAEWISVALLIALIGYMWQTTRALRNEHKKDYNVLRDEHQKDTVRLVKLETKMDIYLEHAGFSVPKIDRAIKQHMEELQQNDRPAVGCINISQLYKDKED